MRPVRAAFAFVLALATASPALAQTTWFVDASAVPPGNGTPASPYTSIQYAHDQATTLTGDTLSIAPGDYPEFLFFAQGKALTLVGAGALQTRLKGGLDVIDVPGVTRVKDLSFNLEPVRFDGSDAELDGVRVLNVRSGSGAQAVRVIDADSTWTDVIVAGGESGGVLISGGSTAMVGCSVVSCTGMWGGLAAFAATLEVTDSFFGSNHVFDGHGGGMYLDNSQTTLVECDFQGNIASLDGRLGGAIYLSGGQLSITGGEFKANRADRGGALAIHGTATLRDVDFQSNVAQRDGTNMLMPGQGGAILVRFNGTLTAEDCQFRQNSAPEGMPLVPEDQRGGAILAEGPGSKVIGSLFADNVAGQQGSAVYGPLLLVQCVIHDSVNTTAGGTVHGAALDRCTVASNTPGPVSAAVVDSTVSSSIVWANANGQLGGTSSATYSCIQGGAAGAGNIASDPMFLSLFDDNFQLTMASPCIDAGSPSAPLDPDLTPADMGALPFTWPAIGASYCSANPNSSGQAATIAALGSPEVADDFLRVQATHTALDQVGLFMMSMNQGFVPLFNGSQGNLCVSAPIFRLTNTPGSVSSSGPQGLLNLRVHLDTLPSGAAILPGQTWHFQAWFRDNVGGNSTSNTSDAVSVTFQ